MHVYDLCSGAIIYTLRTDGFISAIALDDQYLAAGSSESVYTNPSQQSPTSVRVNASMLEQAARTQR